ncbi:MULTISPECIES: hypothetical protein [Bacillus cereus group]|uniref:hypothetical protein n=1 Tax=Bacillus cereus group TaxID=86661 RepID=UPI0018CEDB9F|nr:MULTISPECIES: hypothetical protein [Bacillus cereus group]MBG9840803.1 hypothetical protein [Bacillus tropicus]MBG9875338.1 hypothetical protein [Bacillus tropicus]MBG9923071.1 hypothetical protein [Bacillus tropicus]MBJ8356064.1 hypothetical protein [Bacillus mycoides]MED2902996.1 hypothetical protein [Bacillus tropicus]
MEIPILSEYDYKLKVIKLMYTKETYHEKGKHREYLEENGWDYVGCEDTEDDGIFMFYSKRKSVGQTVYAVDSRPLNKIKFR